MADLYNMTCIKAAETVVDVVLCANEATTRGEIGYGILVPGFLIAIFFVMLMALKKDDILESLVASSTICLILSMFLRMADLVPMMMVLGFAALTLGSVGYMVMTKSGRI